MVPDIRITLPHRGETRAVLHELKVISRSQSRYNPNSKRRGVDTRASLLQGEYLRKARNADRLYYGTEEGQVGKVESKLVELGKVQGLVCGNWGEVSEPFHALVSALATSSQGGKALIATIVYKRQNSPLICTRVVDLDEVWRHSSRDALFQS